MEIRCSKCSRVIAEGKSSVVDISISNNKGVCASSTKYTLCPDCLKGMQRFFDNASSVDVYSMPVGLVNSICTSITKCTRLSDVAEEFGLDITIVRELNQVYVKRTFRGKERAAAVTDVQKDAIIYDLAKGIPHSTIAKKHHVSVCVVVDTKKKYADEIEAVAETIPKEDRYVVTRGNKSKAPVDSEDVEESEKNDGRIDTGKVYSLYKARWAPKEIASEVHCSVPEVLRLLRPYKEGKDADALERQEIKRRYESGESIAEISLQMRIKQERIRNVVGFNAL